MFAVFLDKSKRYHVGLDEILAGLELDGSAQFPNGENVVVLPVVADLHLDRLLLECDIDLVGFALVSDSLQVEKYSKYL